MYFFLAVWALSRCGEWEPLLTVVPVLLIVWLLSLWGPGSRASVVVAQRLICSLACGIFLDQGLNHVPCTGRLILNH